MANRHKHRKHIRQMHKMPKKVQRDPFDLVVYAFGILTPLFELPQLWDIYSNRSAENVSLITWAFFLIDNLVWIIYGIRKREWPVLITSVIYEIIEVIIVVGIVMYS